MTDFAALSAMAEREEDIQEDGKDLFRELLRYYPLAKLNSYYQKGHWLKLQLVTDATLIIAHRSESGAPPPLDLDDVQMPEMPREPATSSSVSHRGARPPAVPHPKRSTETGVSRRAPTPLPPKPPRETPAPRAATAPRSVDQKSGAGEAQMIASFIAKWRVNATRTKLMLSRLLPSKRTWVLDHFRGASSGVTTEDDLRQYIARCEKENVWASSKAIGTKRAAPTVANEPNKRFRSEVVGARVSRPPLRDPPPPARPTSQEWSKYQPSAASQRSTNGSSVTATRYQPSAASQRSTNGSSVTATRYHSSASSQRGTNGSSVTATRYQPPAAPQRSTNGSSITATGSSAEQRSYRAPAIGAMRSSSASTAARTTTAVSARTTTSAPARNGIRRTIGAANSTPVRNASRPMSSTSSTVGKRATYSSHKPQHLTDPGPGDLIKNLLGNVP